MFDIGRANYFYQLLPQCSRNAAEIRGEVKPSCANTLARNDSIFPSMESDQLAEKQPGAGRLEADETSAKAKGNALPGARS